METGMVIFMLVLLALAITGFMLVSGSNKKKSEMEDRIRSLPDFNPVHILIKAGVGDVFPSGLAIDSDSKKICIARGHTTKLIEYSDLIEVEVLVEGISKTKTSRANQFVGTAVGGLFLGGVGAVIGGLSANKTTEKEVSGVSLKLIVNDTDDPVHVIDFIELQNTGATPTQIALKEAESWHDLLSVIIRQAEKEEQKPEVNGSDVFNVDDLQKIANMRENGVISDEEFNLAKSKILS